MGQVLAEIRYAARALRHNPGFTVTVLLVLAIGIGANTAVFSLVYGVLLNPLNYRDSGKLVVALVEGGDAVSPADYFDCRAGANAFESLEAAQAWSGAIQGEDHTEITAGLQVTGGMLQMLGVAPERGRVFQPGDDQPGAPPVLVIGHRIWEKQFGGDAAIIGRTIRVNAQPYTVIGVMPPHFQFAPFWQTQAQMWAPLDLSRRVNDREGRSLRVFGRLRNRASVEQARAQLGGIAARLEQLYPSADKGVRVQVQPVLDKVAGPVRPTLLLLSATVVLVLLIACANISNMLLTRGIGRKSEIALRIAIGASRWRIVRQLAAESLLVSCAGGAAGVLAATLSLRMLPMLLPPASLPRLGEIHLQPEAIVFAVAMSVLTGLACGLFPASESSRRNVHEDLRQASHGLVRASRPRGRAFLIAAEVSIALLLLVCAGLMIRTVSRLNSVDPGFESRNLLSMQVFAPPEERTAERRIALFTRVGETLSSISGVQQVSAINHLPIGGDVWTLRYAVPGRPAPPPGEEPGAVYRVTEPGYFATMRIPVLRGRDFSKADNARTARVVIINRKLAHEEWGSANPVGETLLVPGLPSSPDGQSSAPIPLTIIGVVANARQSDWTSEPHAEFYVPYLQNAGARDEIHLAFVVRTSVRPSSIRDEAERRVRNLDARIAVSDVAPMEDVIGDKMWRSRLSAILLAVFAGIALLLAAIGIYGVIAYSVRQRTREIGIRLALGAPESHIFAIALRESAGAICAGLLAGIAASLGAARLFSALLYNVRPADPVTFTSVVLALAIVSFAATILPARSALRSSRTALLRYD